MLTDQELMAIHVQALFTHDAHSRLLFVNEPGGRAPAPRLFFGRTRAGNLWRFRADLPESLIEELEALCADEPLGQEFHRTPRHFKTYVRLLETHAPVHKTWSGPIYHFTEYLEPSRPLLAITETYAEMLRSGFEDLVAELPAWGKARELQAFSVPCVGDQPGWDDAHRDSAPDRHGRQQHPERAG